MGCKASHGQRWDRVVKRRANTITASIYQVRKNE